ncbi:MAG TPA: radical SAM protein [Ramlibacter sp.]
MTAAAAGPVFTLDCRNAAGEPVRLRYRPHTSELTDEAGTPLLADVRPEAFAPAEAVSPGAPARKSRQVRTLKIQLGMRCNYGCSYCSQASHAPDATLTRTADADQFLAALPRWLQGAPGRIEFWGGEPLLYFAKLRRLVPVLRERFPGAELALITNGSLLDEEIVDFLVQWGLYVGVSHDGPGQHLRGPDPFADPRRAHWLRELVRRGGRRVSFVVVLTPENADVAATGAWIRKHVEDEGVTLDVEGIVSVYDDHALHGAGQWSEAAYRQLHDSIVEGFASGEALRYRGLRERARDFVASLQQERPARALGQKCGMDDPDQLAVDLKGNVMTCQNTGAKGRHRIGHAEEMDAVRLDTATHWSHREGCRHCPVVQLCKGSCMFLEGAHFAQSCENEYRFNLAILAGVIRSLTGLHLERIGGDIRRPRARRTIRLAAASA